LKDFIEEFFNKENSKYEMLINLDTSGARLIDKATKDIMNSKNELSKIEDPKVLFESMKNFIENIDKRFININNQINFSRKIAKARVEAVRDCYSYVLQREEEIKKEEEIKQKILAADEDRIEEIKESILLGEDLEKEKRTIGTRPEKLSNVRKAKSELSGSKKSS